MQLINKSPIKLRTLTLRFIAILPLIVLTVLFIKNNSHRLTQSAEVNWNEEFTTEANIDYIGDFNHSENLNGAWRHLSDGQISKLSKLGRVLFLDEDRPVPKNRTFLILVWKYGYTTHNRHMRQFSDKVINPFKHCAVKNCRVTYQNKAIVKADLVILHLHRTENEADVPPIRHKDQIWAFATDESPYHTFLNGKHNLPAFNGLFNWSMHYRMDADIPIPYGRTLIKPQIAEGNFDFPSWLSNRSHTAPVAIMGSNCGSQNNRWEYVTELGKYIDVDVFGRCGTLKCPGHFTKDCPELSQYRFYLAFENSNCEQYITEKLWWNAYAKEAIPIVMGGSPSRRNYAQLLPPHSYINVDEFASPRDLAAYLLYLLEVPDELAAYFQWKRYFEVRNEHGYFQTPSLFYCRACEALNYNDLTPKSYTNLEDYWSTKTRCTPGWDAEETLQQHN